jgi:hypothetical protein
MEPHRQGFAQFCCCGIIGPRHPLLVLQAAPAGDIAKMQRILTQV